MVAALRKHPEIDADLLREGQYTPRKIDGPRQQSTIGAEDTKLIRKLVSRLRDKAALEEFDLIYSSGRLKMDRRGGLDLIYPEEMRLLERLAALETMAA